MCRLVSFFSLFSRISVGSVVACARCLEWNNTFNDIVFIICRCRSRTGTNARVQYYTRTKCVNYYDAKCCTRMSLLPPYSVDIPIFTLQLLRQLFWQQSSTVQLIVRKIPKKKTQCSCVKTMMTNIAAARLFKNLQSSDESEESVTASIHGFTYIVSIASLKHPGSSSYVIRKHLNILEWESRNNTKWICVCSSSNLRCAVRDEINK